MTSKQLETHFSTWSELTAPQQAEAIARGFPSDAIFTVKNRYGENDWSLVRWQHGTPQRDAHGIIRSIASN